MTHAKPPTSSAPRQIAFSSDQFPADLRDCARRDLWRHLLDRCCGPLTLKYAEGRPFSAWYTFQPIGALGLARWCSTIESFVRTPQCVAAAGSDDLYLTLNLGCAPIRVQQARREVVLAPGAMALIDDARTGEFSAAADHNWLYIRIPRQRLLGVVGEAEDLVSRSFDGRLPAMRHLQRYLDILRAPNGIDDDALLGSHIETTLLDLAALVLGAGRDAAALARMRGLRAARLQAILATIRAGYANPSFSVQVVANRIGLSPRYVQDLLFEAGASFTERVTELRLQKARSMLTSHRFAERKVIDVAFACGFSEVSHFNRAFRRRFGVTPTRMRVGGA